MDGIVSDCLLHLLQKHLPRDLPCPESHEMIGSHLAVDESKLQASEVFNKSDEGDFGGVADTAEHGLAEKDAAEGNTVKPADDVTVLPRFHRMGIAGFVKGNVGGFHFIGDPGAVAVGAFRLGTTLDHRFEILVEGDAEKIALEDLFERFGDAQFIGVKHQTRVGRPPENRLAFGVPGEDAAAIGKQQAVDTEIAADGQQPFFDGQVRRGEREPFGKREDGHGFSL